MNQSTNIKRTHANLQDLLAHTKRNDANCLEWQKSKDSKGYGSYWISSGNRSVHRLVAKLVIANPQNLPCVLHSCDNPLCINPDHLRWGTVAENNTERHNKGRTIVPNNTGSKHGMAILNEVAVYEIKKLLKDGFTQIKIAELYGVSISLISAIHLGKRWGHVLLSDE